MKIFSENYVKVFITGGIIFTVVFFFLFFWQAVNFDFSKPINSERFSQFGSFLIGTIGVLWALVGVILFYIALTEQRADFKTNKDALAAQLDALKQQIEEFQLQREELELTRNVFIEQSRTLKIQQFESTFFNALNLLNNITQNITYRYDPLSRAEKAMAKYTEQIDPSYTLTGKDCFEKFFKILCDEIDKAYRRNKNLPLTLDLHIQITREGYQEFYQYNQSKLGHYFRTVHSIVKLVKNRNLETPKEYTDLLRTQLSTFEQVLLFYYGIYNAEKLEFKGFTLRAQSTRKGNANS